MQGDFELPAREPAHRAERSTPAQPSRRCPGLPFQADQEGHLLSMQNMPMVKLILDIERYRVCHHPRNNKDCCCNRHSATCPPLSV
eukprot:2952102-Prymnesium_polylepis.2